MGALNYLSTLLAHAPQPDDKIETWFARPIVLRLRNVGVRKLTDLVNLVNVYDHPVVRAGPRPRIAASQSHRGVAALAAGVAQSRDARQPRRAGFQIELLVSSGVRRDELAKARRGDVRLETLPDLPPTWVLSVTGKPNKRREVPLADEVVVLLDAHACDVLGDVGVGAGGAGQGGPARNAASAQASFEFVDPATGPLIFALGASVAQWRMKGGKLEAVSVVEEGGGALSGSGIYAVLKRFFARAA